MENPIIQEEKPGIGILGVLASIIGGVIGAAIFGYVYFFIAIRWEMDSVAIFAALFGALAGAVAGLAARKMGMLNTKLLIVLGVFVGIASYGVRYVFEYNDFVAVIVGSEYSSGTETAAARKEFSEFFALLYPPGGVPGYLKLVAEGGLSISTGPAPMEGDPNVSGIGVWLILLLETVVAGVMGVVGTVKTALGDWN
ncbi:MAG: hypothetical protein N2D54_03085 [Chloroflexota bacterium]